jgi:hypothetical protein
MSLVVEDDGGRIPDEVWAQMEPLLRERPPHPLAQTDRPAKSHSPLSVASLRARRVWGVKTRCAPREIGDLQAVR